MDVSEECAASIFKPSDAKVQAARSLEEQVNLYQITDATTKKVSLRKSQLPIFAT